MAGNVLEWCQSLCEPYPYQTDDGREDPKAFGARVLRGGAFRSSERFIRCAVRLRNDPNSTGDGIGFPVVVAPGPSGP
jgi:formylglycine-generating enzyme required for sulfatase activity